MVRKITLGIFMLFFMLTSVGFSSFAKAGEKPKDGVSVRYFYGKPRCSSCQKIERYTEEAVKSINDERVTFKKIDMDKKENKALAKKYGLYTKSVVVCKNKDGKETESKNLSQIWVKLGNEKDFKDYVVKEIQIYLGE